MSAKLKNTVSLFLGVAMLFFSSGMLFVLVVVRAREAGFSTQAIGLLQSTYQIGWLIAAVFTPRLIHRVGHIRVFAAMTATGSAIILLQLLHIEEISWMLERMIMGISIAGLMVVSESWLNEMSENFERGRNLAIYTIVSWGSPVAGIWILRFGQPTDDTFFILASLLISLSSIPLLLSVAKRPGVIIYSSFSLKKLFRITPLGVVGTLFSGMCHGAFFAMLPLYGSIIGFDLGKISTLTSIGLLTGILLHWPIAHASDRFDRRIVLMLTASLAALPAGYFSIWSASTEIQHYCSAALIGAFTLSLYAQCISHANDRVSPDKVVPVAGLLVLIYGTGFAAVPIAMGQFMAIKPVYFFVVNGTLSASLALFSYYRSTRSESVDVQRDMGEVAKGSPYSSAIRAAKEWAEELKSK